MKTGFNVTLLVLVVSLGACTSPMTGGRFDPLPDADVTEAFGDFAPLGRWFKSDLTFRFVNTTSDISENLQRTAFFRAMNTWASVTPLTFTETAVAGMADMVIGFGFDTHCNLYNASIGSDQCIFAAQFDGPGGILAHCYFPNQGPISGDCHFDDAETYTSDNTSNLEIRLQEVALHEMGHALGLDHTDDPDAVMFPSYSPSSPKLTLGADDIRRVQILYGSGTAKGIPQFPDVPDGRDFDVPRAPTPTPVDEDSDGDMVYDSVEIFMLGTDPLDYDTDDDGLTDYEIYAGMNPSNADSDGDGMTDAEELDNDRNPNASDPVGDASAFTGTYGGMDEAGGGLMFTIDDLGYIEGELAAELYGDGPTYVPLHGAANEDGSMIMTSPSRYFVFDGDIVGRRAEGRVSTREGQPLDWFANLMIDGGEGEGEGEGESESEGRAEEQGQNQDGDRQGAAAFMAPDGAPELYQMVPAGQTDYVHPIHQRVRWVR